MTPLERAVLDALAWELRGLAPDLAGQVEDSLPGLRRNTGAGLLTELIVDRGRPASDADATGLFGTAHAVIDGLSDPVAFQVELRQGRLIALHGFSYDQDTRAIDFATVPFEDVFLIDEAGESVLFEPAKTLPDSPLLDLQAPPPDGFGFGPNGALLGPGRPPADTSPGSDITAALNLPPRVKLAAGVGYGIFGLVIILSVLAPVLRDHFGLDWLHLPFGFIFIALVISGVLTRRPKRPRHDPLLAGRRRTLLAADEPNSSAKYQHWVSLLSTAFIAHMGASSAPAETLVRNLAQPFDDPPDAVFNPRA